MEGGGKIASVIGYDKIHSLPSYVDSIQHRNIGTSIQDDRTVDKPLITIYLATPNFAKAKADIRTLNQEIDAFDEEGKSILMHRYDPEKL